MNRALTEAGAKLEQNKYIYSSGVLPTEICSDLSNHLFDLHKQGKLTQDEQCPSSFSIYGDPKFEMVLQDLAGKSISIVSRVGQISYIRTRSG